MSQTGSHHAGQSEVTYLNEVVSKNQSQFYEYDTEWQDGFIADKVKKAEKRIEASPFDTEAWSILIRDSQIKAIEQARPVYERLVSQFGNAGRYWKIFIEHEVIFYYLHRALDMRVYLEMIGIIFVYCMNHKFACDLSSKPPQQDSSN